MKQKYSNYKFKFYLNASHAIYIDGKLGENHPHTWEFILETIKVQKDFIQFDNIETAVENVFSLWQDKNINTIKPFDVVNPTLENITVHFKNILSQLLRENGWLLKRIEVAETPARSYILDISDECEEELSTKADFFLKQTVDDKINNLLNQ